MRRASSTSECPRGRPFGPLAAIVISLCLAATPAALPATARAAGAASADDTWLAQGQTVLLYGEGSYLQTLEAFHQRMDLGVASEARLDLLPIVPKPEADRAEHGRASHGARRKLGKRRVAAETLSFAPTLTPLPNAWAILARHKVTARVSVHLESDPLHQSASRAPGLSTSIIGPLDAGVAWLPGHTAAFEPLLTFALRRGSFRPSLAAGVPLFFSDPARVGVSGVGGVEWLATRDLRFFAQVGGVRYASVPTGYAKSQLVPSLGLTGHL